VSVHKLQRGAQHAGKLRSGLHQLQRVLGIRPEEGQLLLVRTREELRPAGLQVELVLGDGPHVELREKAPERPGRHPKST